MWLYFYFIPILAKVLLSNISHCTNPTCNYLFFIIEIWLVSLFLHKPLFLFSHLLINSCIYSNRKIKNKKSKGVSFSFLHRISAINIRDPLKLNYTWYFIYAKYTWHFFLTCIPKYNSFTSCSLDYTPWCIVLIMHAVERLLSI